MPDPIENVPPCSITNAGSGIEKGQSGGMRAGVFYPKSPPTLADIDRAKREHPSFGLDVDALVGIVGNRGSLRTPRTCVSRHGVFRPRVNAATRVIILEDIDLLKFEDLCEVDLITTPAEGSAYYAEHIQRSIPVYDGKTDIRDWLIRLISTLEVYETTWDAVLWVAYAKKALVDETQEQVDRIPCIKQFVRKMDFYFQSTRRRTDLEALRTMAIPRPNTCTILEFGEALSNFEVQAEAVRDAQFVKTGGCVGAALLAARAGGQILFEKLSADIRQRISDRARHQFGHYFDLSSLSFTYIAEEVHRWAMTERGMFQ